jgi:hypothetical protein
MVSFIVFTGDIRPASVYDAKRASQIPHCPTPTGLHPECERSLVQATQTSYGVLFCFMKSHVRLTALTLSVQVRPIATLNFASSPTACASNQFHLL